jgi:hypothetical protein
MQGMKALDLDLQLRPSSGLCLYCRDELWGEVSECSCCGVSLHLDCSSGLWGCPTLACQGQLALPELKPLPRPFPELEVPPRTWLGALGLAAVPLILALGTLSYVLSQLGASSRVWAWGLALTLLATLAAVLSDRGFRAHLAEARRGER